MNSSPMCDRSKRPARSRTARCSSRMPAYWTGISHPAKSIIRAPSATCRSWSGLRWSVGSRTSVIVRPPASSCPADRRARGVLDARRGDVATRRLHDPRGAGDEVALGLERQQVGRLVEADPADLVELVVVALEVAADRLHQEVV